MNRHVECGRCNILIDGGGNVDLGERDVVGKFRKCVNISDLAEELGTTESISLCHINMEK